MSRIKIESLLLRLVALALSAHVLAPVSALSADTQTLGSGYRSNGRCGSFARAPLDTPDWACVGIVAGPSQGLVLPRAIVQIAPRRFIVTDMGSWSPGSGRVLQLDVSGQGTAEVTVLYDRLDLPHGLAVGPDGKVYIGERSAVWQFDPAKKPAPKVMVVNDLPATGLHRLKHIIFDRSGDLIINIGAPTDRCEGKGRAVAWPCPGENAKLPVAALWRLRMGEGPAKSRLELLAKGLRNSAALAVHPVSGLLLQGENSADYPGENFPPEELNVIEPGKHYGWPYCAGKRTVVPEYKKHVTSCSRYSEPIALLPAHSAPLGMLYYTGELFPELRGKLIVSLHGYRSHGHRIVAATVDETGRPVAAASGSVTLAEVVGGWNPQKARRPLGTPVGLLQAADGSLWFVEDKNRTVMVVLRSGPHDSPAPPPQSDPQEQPQAEPMPPPDGWSNLHGQVIRPICGQCHDELGAADSRQAWTGASLRGWLEQSDLAQSKLFQAILGTGTVRQMPPPPVVLDRKSLQQVKSFLSRAKAAAARN